MNLKIASAVSVAVLLLMGAGCGKSPVTNTTETNTAATNTEANVSNTTATDDSAMDTSSTDTALTEFHDLTLPSDQTDVNGPTTSDGIEYYHYVLAGDTMDSAAGEVRGPISYSGWTVDGDEATDTGWHFILSRNSEKMVIDLADSDSGDGIDVLMGYQGY